MDEMRLEYFLDKFHSDKTSGKDPVVTELCRDYPELADELARRVGILQRIERMADSIGDDLTAPPEDPQPDPAITVNPFWPVVPGYEILAELGRGGMGVVYKARQTQLHRLVALKMILSGNQARAVELLRFRAEAEALAQLKHPNIVHIHEIGEHAGAPFFSMEFVEGGSLAQTLDGKVMPPQKAAKMVQLLANAIHAAHLLHIVHRDLKPGNILLQPDGTPKISDFGLAKRLDTGEGLTHSGDILGSPAYMAPEQAGGKVRNIGPETDVYSLGAILYTMLTGRPPFLGLTVVDVILHVLSQVPIPPRRLQPLVSPELEAICLKCLEKSPHQRYASAADLADDLDNFLRGKPTHRPSSAWNRLELELYCKNIALAEREWSANQYQRMEALLGACPAKLRGWEWHCLHGLQHGKLVRICDHADVVYSVCFSPDGTMLSSTSDDQTIRVRDSSTGDVRQILTGHTGQIYCTCFSPDSCHLAGASQDLIVRIWDLATGAVVRVLQGHTDVVVGVAFSPDGRLIASASDDQTVRIWDARSGAELRTLYGHMDMVNSVSFSPDSQTLASGSYDGGVRVWNVASGETLFAMSGHSGFVWTVVFSPDGRWLASAGGDRSIHLWDAHTGQNVSVLLGDGAVGKTSIALRFTEDQYANAAATRAMAAHWPALVRSNAGALCLLPRCI